MDAADQSVEVESLIALSDDFDTSGPEIHRAGSHTQCLHTLSMHTSFDSYFKAVRCKFLDFLYIVCPILQSRFRCTRYGAASR